MSEEITSDSVIDAIALIELQRQEIGRAPDPEAWRNLALDQLRGILRGLQEEMQRHGPSAERLANAEAVTAEIDRVKTRAGVTSQRPAPKGARPRQPNGSWRGAERQPSRSRGRRTMGRGGGR